jgi:hypothetical protein
LRSIIACRIIFIHTVWEYLSRTIGKNHREINEKVALMKILAFFFIAFSLTACGMNEGQHRICDYYGNCEEEKTAECSVWGNCGEEPAAAEGCGIWGCSNTQKQGECGIWGCGGHANPGAAPTGSIYGTTTKRPDAGDTGGLGW